MGRKNGRTDIPVCHLNDVSSGINPDTTKDKNVNNQPEKNLNHPATPDRGCADVHSCYSGIEKKVP